MLQLYKSNINSYEVLTGKSLAMFLIKKGNHIYLLRGTTVSPYMAKQLEKDIEDALGMGFKLRELVDLFDETESLELYGTEIETFEKYANDEWNWYTWNSRRASNGKFYNRFVKYVKNGIKDNLSLQYL